MSLRDELDDGGRVFVSRRSRDSAIRWGVALLLVFVGSYFLVRAYAPYLTDPQAFRAFVLGFGAWAPLVFVAIQSAQVVVAPIPGQVTGVAAGYLFGPLWGSVYSVLGIAIGSTLAFWLARRYGRAYVERVVTPETLARFDGLAADNAQTALLLAFLVPGLPDDALCFVGGLTDVPLRRLVLVAVVGRAPSFVLSALVGAEAAGENWARAALLAAVLVVLSVLGYLERERLTGYLD
jgi:uncharacterized membrane protein YdjX (TVP38/TMEM64 family)